MGGTRVPELSEPLPGPAKAVTVAPMSQDDAPTHPRSGQLHALVWAENHALIDRQLSPLGLAAMDRLRLGPGAAVLDVGCGTGQTLLQLADRVGPDGQVIGVDIAPLLLDVARQRTSLVPNVRLIEADAQVLTLPVASVDAVYSRFGVMGFAGPVAAFANLRRILGPRGQLAFVCWRGLRENELDHFPLTAAGFAGPIDHTPFSLADPAILHRTLAEAGFSDIVIDPHDEEVSSGDLEAMLQVLLNVGPLGRILRENPDLLPIAAPRLRDALSGRGDPSSVQLRAAVWIVTARAMPAG
jgi:SAM-dependent methyltransferase